MPMLARFGPFELNLESRVLTKFGTRIPLQPQPLEILVVLLQRQGEVVTRSELQAHLWDANVFVDFERNVTRAINKLRFALGDSAEQHTYIQTVSGRGYRFAVTAEWSENPPVEPSWAAESQKHSAPLTHVAPPTESRHGLIWLHRPWVAFLGLLLLVPLLATSFVLQHRRARPRYIPRVVVLPVTNLSGFPKFDMIADGMTEDLITAMDVVGDQRIAVTARTSSMSYRSSAKRASDIARELHADYVVESSLRVSNNTFRTVVQLIRASDESHVWSGTFDRQEADPLLLSTEVSLQVADQLVPKMADKSPPEKAIRREAQFAYIRGQYHLNRRNEADIETSLAYFQQASELDPNFARAFAAQADVYAVLGGGYRASEPSYELARHAAEHALQIDPDCADAYAAIGYVKFANDFEWASSEESFRRALFLDPTNATTHHWYAVYLAAFHRYTEALAQIDEALHLDPLSLPINYNRGFILIQAGRLDEAKQQLNEAIALEPRSPVAYGYLAIAAEHEHDYDSAVKFFTAAQEHSGIPLHYGAGIAHAEAMRGNVGRARELLAQLLEARSGGQENVGAYSIALVYLGLGDRDNALKWIETSVAERSCTVTELNTDISLAPVRSDPRFKSILRSAHLE